MKTAQAAWGWLVAGVLALGLNGIYHDVGAEWAHGVMSRSIGAVALASSHATPFLAQATKLLASHNAAACRTARAGVRVQSACKRSEFAHLDGMPARLEVAMASVEAGRARMEATTDLGGADVVVNDPDLDQAIFPVVVPKIHVVIPEPLVTQSVMKVQWLADSDEGEDPI
jgi:hypothetical protein